MGHSLESAKSLSQIPVFCADCRHFEDFRCKLGYKTNPRNRVCYQADPRCNKDLQCTCRERARKSCMYACAFSLFCRPLIRILSTNFFFQYFNYFFGCFAISKRVNLEPAFYFVIILLNLLEVLDVIFAGSISVMKFTPRSTVSVHSVLSRIITHGVFDQKASFCNPPESVMTTFACLRSASISM